MAELMKTIRSRFVRSGKRHHGFTMVELIVVIAIIAILAAVGVVVAIGYINRTKFDQNSQNAITVYQTAQAALSQKSMNGTIDSWVQELSTVKGNQIFDQDLEKKLKENEEADHSISKSIALTYNPKSSKDAEDAYLYNLLSGYFYDIGIFNGTISLELNITATYGNGKINYSARVLSAFYSKENTSDSGWDSTRIGIGYIPDDPEFGMLPQAKGEEGYKYRRTTSYVGWFNGTSESITAPVGVLPVFLPPSKIEPLEGHIVAGDESGYLFNLRNGETLDVSWAIFDFDGNEHKVHEEDIVIILNNARIGNDTSDTSFYDGIKLNIKKADLDNFLANVDPATTITKENINNFYDITRTSQDGFVQVEVVRTDSGSDVSLDKKFFPLTITKVEGDGRKGTARDKDGNIAPYYEFRLSIDCMMVRADEGGDAGWNHYSIDRMSDSINESGINRLDPINIYAVMYGSWKYWDENGNLVDAPSVLESNPTLAARAMDDPVYHTSTKRVNKDLTYFYYVEFNSGKGRFDSDDSMDDVNNKVLTGRCVVNTLFGDLNYDGGTDKTNKDAISGTFWNSTGGNAVITSYRHLYNIRKIQSSKTAAFRIVSNLDWYVHDQVPIDGTVTDLYTSEVKVFSQGTEGYKSPVMNKKLKIVSFPALRELYANQTLTSMSDTSKRIYQINNVQIRKASFRDSDVGYGLICCNSGTVYNIFTCNLNLVMTDIPDGNSSDYGTICPNGNVTFGTSALRIFNDGNHDLPVGGLIGKSVGKIGLDGVDDRYNTVRMTNCVVMAGDYWNAASYKRVGGLVGICQNENTTGIYGVLELKGSFFITSGGPGVGGLIGDNSTNSAGKFVADGNPVSDSNEFSNKPTVTNTGKQVSCFIGGRGYIGTACGINNVGKALTYGSAIDTSKISYDASTGELSIPDMKDNFQIDVYLPEDSLLLQDSLFPSWTGPCGLGGAVGLVNKLGGDYLNIRVNNEGEVLTLDGTNKSNGCGGAIGYFSESPDAKTIYIEENNGLKSHIGSPNDSGPRYAGGAVGYIDGSLASCSFILNVTNDGTINASGNEDYQGVGGAIGSTGSNYVGRSLISVENKTNSKIVWKGTDRNFGYGAGGAIGSLGKVDDTKINPSETNLVTANSVIYVKNAGTISGVSNVGGAVGFAPRNDGRIYAENSGTIEGLGGTGFVGGAVGRMLYAQRGFIQSILNGATINGSNFVGGAAGRILNFRMDVSNPEEAVVRTVVNGNSTVKSESGSIVGGVAGDLLVQGNGSAGKIELVGHTAVPKLTVFGLDAVGGAIGSFRSDSGRYSRVVSPDQDVTNRLIMNISGSSYVGGAVGLLRPTVSYSNATSAVITSTADNVLKTVDISVVINIVLHPQSSIVGTGDDVGGAIGYISTGSTKTFKGQISVSSMAGDSSGASIISGSRNVGGAIGCDMLSCPYVANGSSDSYGIFVDFSAAPWSIVATTSEDNEANVGGAVGYFDNGLNLDTTNNYLSNIRCYSKTGYNEKQSNYKNNVFPISVNLGSSSVIANGRNVGGAVGKNLIRLGNITISNFSGSIVGKSNVGGAIGLNRSDVNRMDITILGSGAVTGGNSSDVNIGDFETPIDYDGSNVGGAVGYNISRVSVGIYADISGKVEGYGRNVGGAIGFCHFSEQKTFINEIYVNLLGNARVIGHSSNVGGALGFTLGNINTVQTQIKGTSQIIGELRVGGVVGFASAQTANDTSLEGTTGDNVKKNQVGYIGEAIAIISADNAVKGTKLLGGVVGESGFKRFINYNGALRNAYTAPYFGEVKAVINSASVFSPDSGTGPDDIVMAGGIVGHLCDGQMDNVVLGGTGGVVHIDYPNRTFANSVLVSANGRAVGGIVGQIGIDGLQQNVFLSKITIEDNAPYLCVVSGNGSDWIGGWIGNGNGAGGGIGKRNNVSGYKDVNRSSYEVNNVRVVYSEGNFVGGFCGRMDLKNVNEKNQIGARYINADISMNLDEAYILGKSAVGAVAGGLGYGIWETGSITINISNYTNIGDIKKRIPSDGNTYDPICYEAGGAFGKVYYESGFGYDTGKVTFSIPIEVNIDSTSGISALSGSDPQTNSEVGVGGAFGTFKGSFAKDIKTYVNVNTDESEVSVYSSQTNAGGIVGVWVDGKVMEDKVNNIDQNESRTHFYSNASVETAGYDACSGGFAGRILNTGYLVSAKVFGTVTASGENSIAGGFVGNLKAGTLKWCCTTSITNNSTGYSTGGFVGTADSGSISNCYVGGHTFEGQYVVGEGNITGSSNVGGFVGEIKGNVTINQCYSTASVRGTGNNVGGFIGSMPNNGKIQACYSTGSITNSSGDYSTTGAFAGSVAVVNSSRFGDGNNAAKVLEFVNDPAMRLIGSVGGALVDESSYSNRVLKTNYAGININNGTYTGYPFDKGLLNSSTPDVMTATYPLRAFINSTHYGDWPVASSGGISLDSSDVSITLNIQSVEYKKSGNELPENAINIVYTNPETQQTLTLERGTHYSLSYADNKDVGTAKVYISAINGSGFTGNIIKTYEITPVDISSATIVLNKSEYYFTGAPIEPTGSDLIVTLLRADGTIETLEDKKDFYITYVHDIDGVNQHTGIGGVTATIHGTKNYIGKITDAFIFTIIGTDISHADVSVILTSNIYTGNEIIPVVVVRVDGETLTQAVNNDPNNTGDYILTFENNINVGKSTAKVVITGIHNYSGDVERTFSIEQATDTWITTPAISDWIYGSPSDPIGEAASGYSISYKYYMDASLKTATTPDNSGAAEEGGKPSDVGTYYVQARVVRVANDNSAEGVNYYNYTELAPVVKSFTISKADISGATVTFGSEYYHGHIDEYVTPDDITVSLNGTDLVRDKDYVITYPASTEDPGVYSITINGIGNYEGTISGSQYEIVRYYYVEFFTNVDEIIIDDQDIMAGDKATEPVNARDGYTVVWYLDENCELYPYDFDVPVNNDTKLYAKWIKNDDPEPNPGGDDPEPNPGGDDPEPDSGNGDSNNPETGG